VSTATTTTEHVRRFRLVGEVVPLHGLRKAASAGWQPTRPLGGWLMTYGKIGPDGGIVPTVDREGHIVEAARELGHIDWSGYMRKGTWNDTHDEGCIVGMPTSLEFHDADTELAKAHRKVGFWTTGHLFDRDDPQSWAGLTDGGGNPRRPTEHELARADHFWRLGMLLKGLPRPLGFSAHGRMALSSCRRRIIYCEVDAAAVCEVPQNPDATAELLKAVRFEVEGSPLEFLRPGMIGADPPRSCGRCSCAPGSCEGLLRKGRGSSFITDTPSTVAPEAVDVPAPGGDATGDGDTERATIRRAIDVLVRRFLITPAEAASILKKRLKQHKKRQEDAHA
jgi:hypothetical protein